MGNIVEGGWTQAIRLHSIPWLVGNPGYIDGVTSAQIERIFIAELPVKVGKPGNGLRQVAFGGAAGVEHLKEGADQAPPAIVRVCGHIFRLSHAKGNAPITPLPPP